MSGVGISPALLRREAYERTVAAMALETLEDSQEAAGATQAGLHAGAMAGATHKRHEASSEAAEARSEETNGAASERLARARRAEARERERASELAIAQRTIELRESIQVGATKRSQQKRRSEAVELEKEMMRET